MFQVKYNLDGSIERYKARLIAQGFSQMHGIEYIETFSPKIRRKSLRIFLAIAAMLEMILIQMDVVGAYLESVLSQNEQPIHMRIPQGCIVREGSVCKILKSLYELKQAGRFLNKTITKFFQKIGFTPTNADSCILTIKREGELIIVGVYVDDLTLGSRSTKALEWLKDQLMNEFNMKHLGEAKKIIGWEITRDLKAGTLKIDQKRYIRDLLESKGMTSCHSTVLLVKAGSTLFLDQAGDHQQADSTEYQRLIGKLMYLSCGTRPDIAFVVGQLSRHNSNPRVGHLRIPKQVLCYLKRTITIGIAWGNDPAGHRVGEKYREIGVVKYADSSYADDIEDRKSITEYYFFLGGGVITWCSKRQQTVSTSTSEAKYVAVSQRAREGV